MTVKITKPALNLREELASLRNQGGLPKEDKFYLDDLVSNGNFGTSSDWTLDTNWEISNGELHANSTAQYTSARQTLKTTVGKTYKATVTCTSYTSGTFRLYVHDGSGYQESVTFTSTGTHTVTWKAHTSSDQIRVYSYGATAVGTFDNVSVQEVGENLVTNGTFDSDVSGWTSSNSNLSVVSGKLRITNSTAGTYGDAKQLVPVVAGKTYSINITTYLGTGGLYWSISGQGVSTGYLNGSSYDSATFTPTSSGNVQITARITESGSSNPPVHSGDYADIDNVILTEGNHPVIQSIPHGYDVKDVYIDGELAREGEAYDYEVKTDGINQWLKPTIEPTATTETAVIGVRK